MKKVSINKIIPIEDINVRAGGKSIQEILDSVFRYSVHQFKKDLRTNDYIGDRWAVAMGAFFDICEIGYERISYTPEWLAGFKPGLAGNSIDDENFFVLHSAGIEMHEDDINTIGEFLYRLTEALRKTEHHY